MFGKNKEKPFPIGPLYDLGDGKVYQTEDGYTFFPVGNSSILEGGCSESTTNTCDLPSPEAYHIAVVLVPPIRQQQFQMVALPRLHITKG